MMMMAVCPDFLCEAKPDDQKDNGCRPRNRQQGAVDNTFDQRRGRLGIMQDGVLDAIGDFMRGSDCGDTQAAGENGRPAVFQQYFQKSVPVSGLEKYFGQNGSGFG